MACGVSAWANKETEENGGGMNAETCTEVVGATELPAQEPDQVEAARQVVGEHSTAGEGAGVTGRRPAVGYEAYCGSWPVSWSERRRRWLCDDCRAVDVDPAQGRFDFEEDPLQGSLDLEEVVSGRE